MKSKIIIVFILALMGCNKETYIEGMLPDVVGDVSSGNNITTVVSTRNLKNVWKGTYISINNAKINLSTSPFSWQIEKVTSTGNLVIVDKSATSSLKYLNYSASTFSLTSDINPNSSWIFEEIPGNNSKDVRIRHINSGGYLHNETGSLSCGPVLPGWLSAIWTD